MRREMLEALARMLARSQRGANDVGVLRRLRSATDSFTDEARPGYLRGDVYPERFFDWSPDVPVKRTASFARSPKGFENNWNLDMEEQAAIDAMPPLLRARLLAEGGEAHALSQYERKLLRQSDPNQASRLMWGMEEPTLEMAPGASDDLARMFRADGELASPEEFLGRPLTPDHIWEDPRFQQRLDMTSDLEGVRTPAERFRIAEERERLAQQGPHRTASERWGVDDPIVRMAALIGAGGGGAFSLREALAQRVNT